jgi:drug/metabolite transporter (DMT)-like permease
MAPDEARRRVARLFRMPAADVALLLANVVYGTSYVVTRLTLPSVPPAALALVRLGVGTAVLLPLARARSDPRPVSPTDGRAIGWMGVLGFALAFALANWGIERSTATNAALLITVEPITVILLAPLTLGERLGRREALGAALALAGATLVVVNGIPGLTAALVPHWQGDLLLLASGAAYGSYSLIGRHVLARHAAVVVTARSMLWGAVALVPLAAVEWLAVGPPRWTAAGVAGTLYLALVITALGYLVWNWALQRVAAPRAAIFLNVQPLVGALLGALGLGEPLSVFTVAGGTLILLGLWLTVRGGTA